MATREDLRSEFSKHYGPGPHPSGTPQTVHGGGEAFIQNENFIRYTSRYKAESDGTGKRHWQALDPENFSSEPLKWGSGAWKGFGWHHTKATRGLGSAGEAVQAVLEEGFDPERSVGMFGSGTYASFGRSGAALQSHVLNNWTTKFRVNIDIKNALYIRPPVADVKAGGGHEWIATVLHELGISARAHFDGEYMRQELMAKGYDGIVIDFGPTVEYGNAWGSQVVGFTKEAVTVDHLMDSSTASDELWDIATGQDPRDLPPAKEAALAKSDGLSEPVIVVTLPEFYATYLVQEEDVAKHAVHDQQSHGNWATGGGTATEERPAGSNYYSERNGITEEEAFGEFFNADTGEFTQPGQGNHIFDTGGVSFVEGDLPETPEALELVLSSSQVAGYWGSFTGAEAIRSGAAELTGHETWRDVGGHDAYSFPRVLAGMDENGSSIYGVELDQRQLGYAFVRALDEGIKGTALEGEVWEPQYTDKDGKTWPQSLYRGVLWSEHPDTLDFYDKAEGMVAGDKMAFALASFSPSSMTAQGFAYNPDRQEHPDAVPPILLKITTPTKVLNAGDSIFERITGGEFTVTDNTVTDPDKGFRVITIQQNGTYSVDDITKRRRRWFRKRGALRIDSILAGHAHEHLAKHGTHDQKSHGNWARGGGSEYTEGLWMQAGSERRVERLRQLLRQVPHYEYFADNGQVYTPPYQSKEGLMAVHEEMLHDPDGLGGEPIGWHGPATFASAHNRMMMLNYDVRQGEYNHCFANAGRHVIMDDPDGLLTYVEGYALPDGLDMPIHHAWLADSEGNVIDPTWSGITSRDGGSYINPGWAYIGFPIPTERVREVALNTETWGVMKHGGLTKEEAHAASDDQ